MTVREELRDGMLARLHVPELEIRRRTLMIYREQGYLSEPAAELIKLMRSFAWETQTATAGDPAAIIQHPGSSSAPRSRRRTLSGS